MAMCSKCGSMNGDDVVKCPWCAFSKNYADENARLRAELSHVNVEMGSWRRVAERLQTEKYVVECELEKAEAALAAVAALHDEYDGPHTYCHDCGGLTPCATRRALRDAKGDK